MIRPTRAGFYSCGGSPDDRGFAIELFVPLLTCYVMERTLFGNCEIRLQLDPRLTQMPQEFEVFKEHVRRKMIADYKIKPPATKPTRYEVRALVFRQRCQRENMDKMSPTRCHVND